MMAVFLMAVNAQGKGNQNSKNRPGKNSPTPAPPKRITTPRVKMTTTPANSTAEYDDSEEVGKLLAFVYEMVEEHLKFIDDKRKMAKE